MVIATVTIIISDADDDTIDVKMKFDVPPVRDNLTNAQAAALEAVNHMTESGEITNIAVNK